MAKIQKYRIWNEDKTGYQEFPVDITFDELPKDWELIEEEIEEQPIKE